jgi:hypothetical protein
MTLNPDLQTNNFDTRLTKKKRCKHHRSQIFDFY